MKVDQSKNSWSFIPSTLKKIVSSRRSVAPKSHVQKIRPDRRFISWPTMPGRQINALVGYDWLPVIDIGVLEKFISRQESKNKETGYRLAGRSLDDFSMLEMKRAVDIERMMTLLKSTLTDMKVIAAINGSHHKG